MKESMTDISVKRRNLERLGAFVTGFGKTADDAIEAVLGIAESCDCHSTTRLSDSVESSGEVRLRDCDSSSPPSLKHTTILSAQVNGTSMPRGQNYWNNVMHEATRQAAKTGKSTEEIFEHSTANVSLGERSDNGFKFISEAGISIQGQNSDNAWKQIDAMAKLADFQVEVEFRWQQQDDAAFPGQIGRLYL
ncbi:T4SS efffector SepA family protein [Croceicoccus sediminis]|uniref:T4SS efffector SepA family protein n=1 Tax=Croceicoccus sediminis TaxID=2571150 RepID=UPI0011829FBF|nr:hypothetical protein [Croceicoccus sediminis]